MPPPLGSQPGDTYPLLRLLVLLRFLLYLCLIITDSVTDVNTKMTCVTKFRRFNNKKKKKKTTPCHIFVTLSHSKRCETSVILTKHMVGESLGGNNHLDAHTFNLYILLWVKMHSVLKMTLLWVKVMK